MNPFQVWCAANSDSENEKIKIRIKKSVGKKVKQIKFGKKIPFHAPPIPRKRAKRKDLMQQLWHHFLALFTRGNNMYGVLEMYDGRILL